MNLLVAAFLIGTPLPAADYEPAPTTMVTVDGIDYPVCALEDCSDQPGQIGAWQSPVTGQWWLSLGDYSVPVTP